MKIIVQRCDKARVLTENKVIGQINKGMMLLVAFTLNDDEKIIDYMIKKVINLRIFDDDNGIMNKSILEVNGSILSISQFTLYADTKKGNRPSYMKALNNQEARKLYDLFNKKLSEFINVATGAFGEEMKVDFVNDGPITIILEKENNNAQE